ncbi:MAG: VWA domain-containing protein [Candidatus Latescibacteria bacterium]|nr:VWA domain-containing protein [Candidatus Latescibacterota bacterium]NIT02308.1 VWA domain-containing protein [Candidatus Latescibacterota bacterium]NIT39193.1 VWA domain-containing protein [Candidatus Latescibacterota bacterium]
MGSIFLTALVICLFAASAEASGILIPRPPVDRPPVEIKMRPLSFKSQHVSVSINNQAAKTTIKQIFQNHTNRDLEGTYIFPIPEKASISKFSMWMNGRKVEGELLDAGEARKIYNDIVRRMRDPGLLEYAGRDLFRANVYPIPKHGEVKIELAYEEVLEYDSGVVGYRYPLNVERCSPTNIEEVSIAVNIQSNIPIKTLYSPTHDIDIENSGESAYCGYEEKDVRPDRDFILYYTVSGDRMGLNLLTHRRGEDGYFILLLSPGTLDDPDAIVKKDIVFVIDRSGSMQGKKIEQAKDALEYCVKRLNEGDRFNIITFSTGVVKFSEGMVRFSKRDLARALRFVKKIKARGGTNINDALQAALDFPKSKRSQMIVFLTDGLPTVGETDLGAILGNVKDENAGDVRIFPFGVGYDVNTHLLDKLCEDNRGTVEYIKPEEDIEEKVSAFYSKVSNPVLSNVDLDFGDVKTYDVYPNHLPDIFDGAQLVVFGRYEGRGRTRIRLTGYVGEDEKRYEYSGRFGKRESRNAFIPRLWATRKIAYLLSEIRLHGHNDELVDEVIILAKEHGIVTPYTSYLVLDEQVALEREMHDSFGGSSVILRNSERSFVEPGDELRVRGGRRGEVSFKDTEGLPAPPASGTGKAATEYSQNVARGKEQKILINPLSKRVKYVDEKTFYFIDDRWVDEAYKEDMTVIEIKYLSDEYFELLDNEPEVGKYLSLGTEVTFVHGGKAYRIVTDE